MPRPPSPPPTNEAGAIANPRQLNRWLDVNPVYPLTRTETFWQIPAFSLSGEWKGYSEILGVFNYTASNNFSLRNLSLPIDESFVPCIMWVDEDLNVFRYALWRNVGEVFYFPAPLYSGQLIKKNFRIEIWSTVTSIDLSVITVAGAGTGAANGLYNQVSSQVWGNLLAWNIASLDGAFSGIAGINNVITGHYITAEKGVFGLWTTFGSGADPAPVVSAPVEASMNEIATVYTTVRGNVDYMWGDDNSIATPSTVITDFQTPLPANLPMTFPEDSVPVINI